MGRSLTSEATLLMPVSAETLRLLMEAGIEGEQLFRIVESIDNAPKQRSANAERQARFRAKKRAESVTGNVTNNVTSNVTSVTNVTPLAHGEDNLPTKNQAGKADKKKTKGADEAEFRAELIAELSPDQLDGVIKVRRDKSGQVTRYSAQLFRGDAKACSMTLSQAADACISRGWITVKPEYFQRRSSQAPPSNGVVGAAQRIIESRANGSEIFPSNHGNVERLSAEPGDKSGTAAEDLRSGIGRRFGGGNH